MCIKIIKDSVDGCYSVVVTDPKDSPGSLGRTVLGTCLPGTIKKFFAPRVSDRKAWTQSIFGREVKHLLVPGFAVMQAMSGELIGYKPSPGVDLKSMVQLQEETKRLQMISDALRNATKAVGESLTSAARNM